MRDVCDKLVQQRTPHKTGIREKGKPHKVVEYLRQHSTVPFLIVQPENVRNVRMRLTSDQDGRNSPTLATSPPALATVAEADEDATQAASDSDLDETLLFGGGYAAAASTPVEASTRPRKIAIAYENDATGQMLLAFAARVVLQPHDSVLLVHCMVGKKEAEVLSSSAKSLEGVKEVRMDTKIDPGCMPRPGGVAGVCLLVVSAIHGGVDHLVAARAHAQCMTTAGL